VVERVSTEAPANITEVPGAQVENTAGTNLDDRLRYVPGFSLFRRTSSLVANPTTQGVSLRGIGSSGASRTLVLWEGIPVNDPFGGWVYWSRFSPEEMERVEISRGASTSVFGDRALGGTIAMFSREPEHQHFRFNYEGGNKDTHDVSAGYSNLWSNWAISGGGRGLTTDGFFVVPESVRGPVDHPANVHFATGDLRLDWFSGANRVFIKGDLLAEERRNGTLLTYNSTSLGTVAGHFFRDAGRNGFSLLGYHTREEFHSTFSAVAPGRSTERLTFRQTVPAEGTGGAGVWRRNQAKWHLLTGADVFRAEGFSNDVLYPAGRRVGGGDLLQHGIFAQGDVIAGPLTLFGGARHDFTGQDRKFFSPSGGLVFGRGRVRARGSVYRSFRAPTLNELYREFRVGNAVTRANAGLRPETLFGAEAGIDFLGESSSIRASVFRNSLQDLITNVTLSFTPNLIVRQRQNAAEALNRGFEFDARHRHGHFTGRAGYLFVDSRFATGFRVPQIPKHQGSGMLMYERAGTLASLGVRSYALQFEDERNQFLLPGYATLEFVVRQALGHGLSAHAAVENALDREYFTGFTPTPTIGTPRLWRIGFRWEGRLK
jgi:outer membrane receptor protein involved in Fe transport